MHLIPLKYHMHILVYVYSPTEMVESNLKSEKSVHRVYLGVDWLQKHYYTFNNFVMTSYILTDIFSINTTGSSKSLKLGIWELEVVLTRSYPFLAPERTILFLKEDGRYLYKVFTRGFHWWLICILHCVASEI